MARSIMKALRRGAPAKKRQDKTLKTIALLERKLPIVKRVSRSPKYGEWMPSIVALVGAFASLLLIFVLPPLLDQIPWPQIDISLPHIELPAIALPKPPQWLADIMFWLQKTWPIWIAAGFLFFDRRRRQRAS